MENGVNLYTKFNSWEIKKTQDHAEYASAYAYGRVLWKKKNWIISFNVNLELILKLFW